MTQYATRADMARLGVTVGDLGDVSNETLDANLVTRSSFADGYLGVVFALPLSAWGDDLRLAVCQLAAWDTIGVVTGLNPEDATGALWRERRDEALRWLERVADGKVRPIGVVEAPAPAEATEVLGFVVAGDPLRGW